MGGLASCAELSHSLAHLLSTLVQGLLRDPKALCDYIRLTRVQKKDPGMLRWVGQLLAELKKSVCSRFRPEP